MNNNVFSADIIYDAQSGDSGKGKVSSFLASKNKPNPYNINPSIISAGYSFVARWAGGANAGHTVYLNGNKYKTHMIPSGIFHGIKSFIGPGCVVNLDSIKKEFSYLDKNGFDINLVKISPMAHIVTEKHLSLDKEEYAKKLGTTSSGIAPAYGDKYLRTGTRFSSIDLDEPFEINGKKLSWDNFIFKDVLHGDILCEGAQGFYLDVNWGNYPYITSSETLPYAACSLGFSPKKIRNIYAVAKIYETRSGEDPLFPDTLFDNPELAKIGELGSEYGVTTGRRRKVNYLNLDRLIFALNTAGGNKLIISKCDILEIANIYKLYYNDELIKFSSMEEMKNFIKLQLKHSCYELREVFFSYSPEIVEGV